MAIVYGTNLTETINLYNGATEDDDVIFALAGHDFIFAAGGDDVIKGGGGMDHINGGEGIDTAAYTLSDAGVFVSLLSQRGSGGEAEGDTLVDIENLAGSAHGDDLRGDNGVNELRGLGGADRLKGYGGDDRLFGGGDNDILYGMGGADLLDGGPGADSMTGGVDDDTYMVDNIDDVVIEAGGQGNDAVCARVSWTLTEGADIETLRTISPNSRDPISLTGNSSGNVIMGNSAGNTIAGGGGNDQLVGFGGEDRFYFDSALDAATNIDDIVDFDVSEDHILLDGTIFDNIGYITAGLPPGTALPYSQHFAIGTGAQDADDRLIYDDTTGALFYDSDGTGETAAIQFAQLSPGLALTVYDFLLAI